MFFTVNTLAYPNQVLLYSPHLEEEILALFINLMSMPLWFMTLMDRLQEPFLSDQPTHPLMQQYRARPYKLHKQY